MSNSYKKAMDKIAMSEELKQKIINNTPKLQKQRKRRVVYVRRFTELAACVAICSVSYLAVSHYTPLPVDEVPTQTNKPVTVNDNTKTNDASVKDNMPPSESISNSADSAAAENAQALEISESAGYVPKRATGSQSAGLVNSETEIQATFIYQSETLSETYSNDNQTDNTVSENTDGFDVLMGASGNPLTDSENGGVQACNPVKDLKGEIPKGIKIPHYIPSDYTTSDVSDIIGMTQIVFESDKDRIFYRTESGYEGDISGDYNVYDSEEIVSINENAVTLKSNDELYFNAVWTENDNSYSVSSDNGIEKQTMTDIIESVDYVE